MAMINYYISIGMDINFLTAEQLELAFRLSDILSIEDLTVSAAILASVNWNIQAALGDLQLGSFQPQPSPSPNPIYHNQNEEEYYQEENNYEYEGPTFQQKKRFFEEEHISLVPLSHTLSEPRKQTTILQFHKILAEDSKNHRGKYLQTIMQKSQALCKDILESNPLSKRKYNESKLKIQNNSKFINTLYTQYQPRWNFTFGTFFLNLTRSHLEGKHLLVYIHSLNPQTEKNYHKILDLLFRQKEIANFVNQHCVIYGIFDNSDEYDILQKYAPLKDLPAFALFAMSKERREEQFISSYKISGDKQIFMEWLAKNMGIKLTRRESKSTEQKKGGQAHTREKTKEELEKQAQARKKEEYNAQTYLREQQDELYFELQKTYNQKRQLSLDRKQHLQQQEQGLRKRVEQALKQKEASGEDVIEIRFRIANTGQTQSRRFYLEDKAGKLFQYVDCFCREHFQEKFNDFDLIQTHPSLVLSHFKEKTLNEIFEGSTRENLIVRQL